MPTFTYIYHINVYYDHIIPVYPSYFYLVFLFSIFYYFYYLVLSLI